MHKGPEAPGPVWKSEYHGPPDSLIDLRTGQNCTTEGTKTCRDRRHASDGL